MCRLSAMRDSAESIFVIEYLSEYEFIFGTSLTCEPGDLGLLFDEGRKSRDSVHLNLWQNRHMLISKHFYTYSNAPVQCSVRKLLKVQLFPRISNNGIIKF
jgi:hypothetical protein